jgi:hypothetical protein
MGNSEQLEGEDISHDQKMERGSSKTEQPAGIKRGGKRQILNAVYIDKQYLESLKEIGKRLEEARSDSDRIFLLNRLPALKQLSPLDNIDFRGEVQETLRRKLRRLAAPEVQPITYPSTSSDSPALSQYSVNSQISLVDYTSATEGRQRNDTHAVTVVKKTGSSAYSATAPRGSSIQTVMEGSSM